MIPYLSSRSSLSSPLYRPVLTPKKSVAVIAMMLTLAASSSSALAAGPTTSARGFDCLIEPRQVVEVRSPVEGVIEQVFVERGGFVRKGEVLVALEASVERSNLAVARHRSEMKGRVESARYRVEFASKKLERAQELLKEGHVSVQVRDEAQTERRLAESELQDALESQEQARLEFRRSQDVLNQRQIRSPFDAYVAERLLQPGDLAEAGTGRKPILKLAQIDVLRVEVVMPQDVHGLLRVGARALVRPEGSGSSLPATVTIVDRIIDAASATFGVRLELSNANRSVPAGTRCNVEFPGLVLPVAVSAPAAAPTPAAARPVSR